MAVDERMKLQIEAEMNLWYQFKHPNAIQMFGASHVSSPPFIVCEDATDGDVAQFLLRSEATKCTCGRSCTRQRSGWTTSTR
jgi:hypothetical protein